MKLTFSPDSGTDGPEQVFNLLKSYYFTFTLKSGVVVSGEIDRASYGWVTINHASVDGAGIVMANAILSLNIEEIVEVEYI